MALYNVSGVVVEGDLYDERFNPEFAGPAFKENGDPIPTFPERLLADQEKAQKASLPALMTGEGDGRQWPRQ